MKDKKWLVYTHISPSNKYYIGITSQNVKKRWRNGNGYKDSVKFYNAIKKYGWDDFKHIVLIDNLDRETANEIEKYLISKYDTINNGYNITEGGYTSNPKISKKERQKNSKRNIKIYRYNLDGYYKDEFISLSEAERITNILGSSISSCANGKIGQAGGYMWRKYKKERIKPYINSNEVPVDKYTLDGKYIESFKSAKIASEKDGKDSSSIIACCKGKVNRVGDYIYKYHGDKLNYHLSEIKHINQSKKVYKYNFYHQLIEVFESIMIASEHENLSITCISDICNGKHKPTGDFYYSFSDKPSYDIQKYTSSRKKKVAQYDIHMNLINIFESLTDASKITGISISSINGVLKGRCKTTRIGDIKYIWRYV